MVLFPILFLAGCSFISRESLSTPSALPVPIPTHAVGVYRGDLHIHTNCSDGHNTYDQMIQAALAAGLDFIAITDHFWCPETIARCESETRLVCFPGKEISESVHILAVGIPSNVNVGPVKDVVSTIHKLGGVAIASHPYREDKKYTSSLLLNSDFDAMECNFHQDILLTFDTQSMACVWDSDAHEVSDIAAYPATTTACDIPIKTIDDLKTAIAGGHCQPGN